MVAKDYILDTTTNQKHSGMGEEEKIRTHNQ